MSWILAVWEHGAKGMEAEKQAWARDEQGHCHVIMVSVLRLWLQKAFPQVRLDEFFQPDLGGTCRIDELDEQIKAQTTMPPDATLVRVALAEFQNAMYLVYSHASFGAIHGYERFPEHALDAMLKPEWVEPQTVLEAQVRLNKITDDILRNLKRMGQVPLISPVADTASGNPGPEKPRWRPFPSRG